MKRRQLGRSSSVTKMISTQGDHIVLISCSATRVHWNEIALICSTLRTPLRAWEHKPIMVLTTENPPLSLAEEFPDVGFCVGVASNIPDLEAVLLGKAAVVVLLAGDAEGDIIAELRDHTAVVVANTLDLLDCGASSSFVMYELHVEGSAQFVPSPIQKNKEYRGVLPMLASQDLEKQRSKARSSREDELV